MKPGNKSILELADQFKSFEVRNRLFFEKTAGGVFYWNIVRYHVYMTVLSHYGIYENVTAYLDKAGESKLRKLARAIRLFPLYLINEIRVKFFLPVHRKYYMLLISRFEDEKGNPVDLLLRDIQNQLDGDVFLLEYFRHRSFSLFKNNLGARYFMYPLEMRSLLTKTPAEDWSKISALINEEFGIDFNWNRIFNTKLKEYDISYQFFLKLFRRHKPSCLFFQSDPKGMIAAANECGVLTLDMQHGHTNNTDMFYSYPKEIDLSHITSIPKIFLTLGNFWNDHLDFPNQKVSIGSSYFHIAHDEQARDRKGIMAVSSLFVHEYLKEQVAGLARRNPGFVFYYKLHSAQGSQIRETKDFFEELQNVVVVYTEKSVKEVMEDCFAITLIQSSVAYQALQKGLNVFIFKKDYYEASYDIFGQKGVVLIEDWEELSRHLSTFDFDRPGAQSTFFEAFKPEVLNRICKTSPAKAPAV